MRLVWRVGALLGRGREGLHHDRDRGQATAGVLLEGTHRNEVREVAQVPPLPLGLPVALAQVLHQRRRRECIGCDGFGTCVHKWHLNLVEQVPPDAGNLDGAFNARATENVRRTNAALEQKLRGFDGAAAQNNLLGGDVLDAGVAAHFDAVDRASVEHVETERLGVGADGEVPFHDGVLQSARKVLLLCRDNVAAGGHEHVGATADTAREEAQVVGEVLCDGHRHAGAALDERTVALGLVAGACDLRRGLHRDVVGFVHPALDGVEPGVHVAVEDPIGELRLERPHPRKVASYAGPAENAGPGEGHGLPLLHVLEIDGLRRRCVAADNIPGRVVAGDAAPRHRGHVRRERRERRPALHKESLDAFACKLRGHDAPCGATSDDDDVEVLGASCGSVAKE
eukprot:PhM_4_TR5408/c0_g1_i1/m.77280